MSWYQAKKLQIDARIKQIYPNLKSHNAGKNHMREETNLNELD